jgi:hypothetical protein
MAGHSAYGRFSVLRSPRLLSTLGYPVGGDFDMHVQKQKMAGGLWIACNFSHLYMHPSFRGRMASFCYISPMNLNQLMPNHSPDPTLASGTPRAGHEPRLP